ncbi:MAG: hypothetical protein RPS47_04610 [Colwellia sp.]
MEQVTVLESAVAYRGYRLTRNEVETHHCLPKTELDEYSHDQLVGWAIDSSAVRSTVWIEMDGGPVVVFGASYCRAYFEAFPEGVIDAKIIDSPTLLIKKLHESTMIEFGGSILDEAKLLRSIKDYLKKTDLEIGKCLALGRATITNRLNINNLHTGVHKYIQSGFIDKQAAKYLLQAPLERQALFAKMAYERNWSTKVLYSKINPAFVAANSVSPQKTEFKKGVDILRFEQNISEKIGLPMVFTPENKENDKGALSFKYSSYDEFTRLMDIAHNKGHPGLKFSGELKFDGLNLEGIDRLLSAFLLGED